MRNNSNKIRFQLNPDATVTIFVEMEKVIGGIHIGNEAIVTCGGDKAMIRDENAKSFFKNAGKDFETAKNVLIGNVKKIQKNIKILRF